MAEAFRMARVGELVHPEGLVLGGLAAGHLLARSMDMAFNLTKPFRRVSDWIHVLALGGSAWLYARAVAPEITKTVFIGDSMLVVTSLGDLIFERTAGPKVRALGKARAREKIAEGDGARPSAKELKAAEERSLLTEGAVLPSEIPVFVDEEIAA